MSPNLPDYISIMFMVVTFATVLIVFYSIKIKFKKTAYLWLVLITIWLFITGTLADQGFYLSVSQYPARFLLAAPTAFVVIIILFFYSKSRQAIKSMSPLLLHYLSAIRIPVELILWWMYLFGDIPELMTFEGRNFYIIAGITAPLVAYFCFQKKTWPLKIAWYWNIGSLILLLNIIINAILSAPLPIQVQAFDQPNVGILYFPMIWLPAFVAPAVLFSHFANFLILNNLKKAAFHN